MIGDHRAFQHKGKARILLCTDCSTLCCLFRSGLLAPCSIKVLTPFQASRDTPPAATKSGANMFSNNVQRFTCETGAQKRESRPWLERRRTKNKAVLPFVVVGALFVWYSAGGGSRVNDGCGPNVHSIYSIAHLNTYFAWKFQPVEPNAIREVLRSPQELVRKTSKNKCLDKVFGFHSHFQFF